MLLCSAVTLLISLCGPVQWLLMTVLVLVSFLASMMVVYGKKSMPLQLAALFIMTMSMEHQMTWQQSFHHAGLFMLGGLIYLAYAMAIAWVLRHRIKQQVLAEALFELAAYIDIKADFYDTRFNLTEQFNKLVRHQSILADRQQASRDLILRSHKNSKDAIVVQVHVCMLDLYELILSTHTDYALLRQHLADSDGAEIPARPGLQGGARHRIRGLRRHAQARFVCADQLRHGMGRHRSRDCPPAAQKGDSCARGTGDAARAAQQDPRHYQNDRRAAPGQPESLRQRAVLGRRRHGAIPVAAEVRAARSCWQPAPGFARSSASPCACRWPFRSAWLVGHWLPYAAHSYWIVLTIVIILRPTFSMTRQRRADRIIGTIIGCVVTAIVIRYVHSNIVLMAILFLSIVATPTFIYLRYRYTAIAVSLMILLQMHLVAPSNPNLVSERLIDTLIGAAVATVFSFVLANWEYQSLPRLVRQVLNVNLRYMQASFALLQGKCFDDFAYRIERKRLMDSLAALSSALVRMLDEPASKQRAVEDINLFIVQNYLLVAHVAALRSILGRHASQLPVAPVNALLGHSHTQVCLTLSRALDQLDDKAAISAPLAAAAAPPVSEVDWSGWPLVKRRIRLLQADADKIVVHSAAIVHIVAPR